MKKLSYILISIFIVIASIAFVYSLNRKKTSRIVIKNTGNNVIEIKADSRENKITLGQNGISKFERDSRIEIGNAIITVGKRVEIENTGSDVIQITYNDNEGSEQKLLLGQGGAGYINKSTPFKIGNAFVQVN